MFRRLPIVFLFGFSSAVIAADPPTPEFPRRALGICVSEYLYANPINYGTDARGALKRDFGSLLTRFSDKLRFPRKQVVELSDAATGAARRPPLKAVIEPTVTHFLDSSRKQDRIVVIFVGHAVDLDGKPYLVPIDGDLFDAGTLVPLAWLMDRLDKCPAQQKLFIADLRRYDPVGGQFRPSNPLPPKVAAALRNPPDSVQVWSACSEGEYSYEIGDYATFEGFDMRGGTFLSLFFKAFQGGLGIPRFEDPLPIDVLAEAVNADVRKMLPGNQSPFVAGKVKGAGVPFDPKEAPARVVDLPTLEAIRGKDSAEAKDIAALLAEVQVPPIHSHLRESNVPPFALLPFSGATLRPYAADKTDAEILAQPQAFPSRVATLKAVESMRALAKSKETPWELTAGDPKKLKASIVQMQRGPAKAAAEMQDALDALTDAEAARAKDAVRWRAHYDLTRARLLIRIAHFNEVNLMYGQVRRDAVPELDKAKGHDGWRLIPADKMQSPAEIRDLVKEANKVLAKIEKDHAGTPWAVLAKRERLTRHGLEWVAAKLK